MAARAQQGQQGKASAPVPVLVRQSRTLVLVLALLKGGVGKTRLAVLAALYLARMLGLRVLLVDADTTSQSTWSWYQDVLAAAPETWPQTLEVIRHPFEDIDQEIARRAPGVDVVVVDVGGGSTMVLQSALTEATHLLSPVGADRSETRRLAPTWQVAQNAAAAHRYPAEGFVAHVVLSRSTSRSAARARFREELAGSDYPLLEAEMVYRPAGYSSVFGTVPRTTRQYMDVPEILREIGIITSEEIS